MGNIINMREQEPGKITTKHIKSVMDEISNNYGSFIDVIGHMNACARQTVEAAGLIWRRFGVTEESAVMIMNPGELNARLQDAMDDEDGAQGLVYEYQDDDYYYTAPTNFRILNGHLQIVVALTKETDEQAWLFDLDTKKWNILEESKELLECRAMEKQMDEILEDDTPMQEFKLAILGHYGPYTDDDYNYLRRKHGNLLKLYNQTNSFMDFEFHNMTKNDNESPEIRDKDVQLYLLPADSRRHGFAVTEKNGTYQLIQFLTGIDFLDGDADLDEYDDEYVDDLYAIKPYEKIVGTTTDIGKMIRVLRKMGDRFTKSDIFTIPLSLNAYAESHNPERFKHVYTENKKREATEEERKNLDAAKRAVHRFLYE